MNSFLYPKVPRVKVFRSVSYSQSIRQRIRRRTVTLYFNLHWDSQVLVYRSQGLSNLTSFHHCVKLRFSNAQGCQALKRGSRFQCGKPQSLSTNTVILSTCFCLRNLSAALGFPTRYRAARFNGTKSNSRGSFILWANLSWAKYESLMQAADLYLVASSLSDKHTKSSPRTASLTS